MYLFQHLHGSLVWCGVAVWESVIIHNYVFMSAPARVSSVVWSCGVGVGNYTYIHNYLFSSAPARVYSVEWSCGVGVGNYI